MFLEAPLQKKDSAIVIPGILFFAAYLLGIQYEVELYVVGFVFTATLMVLVVWDVRIFYFFYFISFFIQIPVFPHYPTSLGLTDILFPFFVIIRMGSYIYEGKTFSSLIPDRRILLLLTGSLTVILVSYVINFSSHTFKYQAAGVWAIYRMVQPLIVFILFSEKNISVDFSHIFSIFIIMTLIQIPVIISQALVCNLPLGVSTFITGTFSLHHSGMGTFMLVMFFLTYFNYTVTQKTSKKALNLSLMGVVALLMFVSASRSAILGLLISVAVLLALHIKLNIKSILTSVSFLTIGGIFLYFSPFSTVIRNTFFSPFSGSLDISSVSRIIIWRDSIRLFMNADVIHKIFGIGMYFSAETLKTSVFVGKSWFLAASHNNYLTALVETGIIGFILFVFLYGTILFKLFKAYKTENNTFALSLFLMTVALLGSSITQETFWCHDFTGSLLSCYYFLLALFFTKNLRINKKVLVENQSGKHNFN